MDEFEIMRQQLASMKQQLDTQQIVNHDLMRKVMRAKASWMNILVTAELIILPFLYLFIAGLCHSSGISQWYSFAFLILGGADAILDIRTVRIPTTLFSSSSILNLRKFLVRQKRERFIQTIFSSTLCVVWFSLFVIAIFSSGNPAIAAPVPKVVQAVILSAGIILSVIIIATLYRKMQRTNDRILADIATLESED